MWDEQLFRLRVGFMSFLCSEKRDCVLRDNRIPEGSWVERLRCGRRRRGPHLCRRDAQVNRSPVLRLEGSMRPSWTTRVRVKNVKQTSSPGHERSAIRIKAPKRSDQSDGDFLRWLTSIGGTPPELLENPEVLKLFLPALKADLHVVENFSYGKPDVPILSCPLTCFDGREDVPHDLQAWRDVTSGEFTVRMFDGSHFYLKDPENEKILLDFIRKSLEASEMDYL
ncbi:S-acyl fatty acid synthase thioesterase, medium chain isoform X2 [Nothobranchius furzeri]|uniref:S-acyl fatty acid synthase thioesterase, medium chain isoform X2 n=1 Tax=Nothobranchius furzeri TaxID=105023 RepID=UPI00077D1295|nr:S-acyl fatty acid synthase thioesterase, medium chain isoform X2 [Nothobranchius furzeri]